MMIGNMRLIRTFSLRFVSIARFCHRCWHGARSYAQPGAMRAGFEVFRNFEQDAKDFVQFAETKLTMPMLVLTGEKASGEFLIEQARLVDTNVAGVVIKSKGHWLMEEAPQQVIPQLVAFINKSQ
jgi:pimeloyl-ACP methyl ester carboxylesterase